MIIHFKIIGVLLMALAIIHLIFPRYFNWKTELAPLSLINRQMMIVHTFFIALVVFLMGLLCFTSAYALFHTPLGKTVCLGLSIFWACRLFVQFFAYSSELWRGKMFETTVHMIFSVLWIYITAVFFYSWMTD